VLGQVFLVIGGLALLLAAVVTLRRLLFLRRALRASGVVVGRERVIGRAVQPGQTARTTQWAPEVEFRTATGEVRRFVSQTTSTQPGADGTPIEVFYLPEPGGRAEIARFGPLWGLVVVWATVAAVFGGLGSLIATGLLEIS
jgi:hypothetical protein